MKLFVYILAGFLLVNTAMASSVSYDDNKHVQMSDYELLFDRYSWIGCVTGATVGLITISSSLTPVVGLYHIVSTAFFPMMIGCSLGRLFSPLGVVIQDKITGDNAMQRFLIDFQKQLTEQQQSGP